MSEETRSGTSRRGFLRQAALTGAGIVAGATTARAAEPDPKITEVQEWATAFGDPVDAVGAADRVGFQVIQEP